MCTPAASCVNIMAVKGNAITPVTLTGTGGPGAPYTFIATGLPTGLSSSTGGSISGTPTVTGTFTFFATGLPAGLSMSSSATISGTPTAYGTFNYTVTITDKQGNKGTITCTVVVAPPDTTPRCARCTPTPLPPT
ncbi:MAG: putative Ig domain-containing protein [bacterium]